MLKAITRRSRTWVVAAIGILTLIGLTTVAGIGQSQEAPIKVVSPAYPLLLLHGLKSGDVTLKLQINTSGTVSTATLEEGSKLFFQVAKRAALKWKFRQTDKPSHRAYLVKFKFTLLSSNASPEDAQIIFTLPNIIEIRARMVEIEP
ncbi:MAG TPA: energy transducer TonB [Pyrinomonadaceae bacterium]|nr:energy transducer TonB [Pyrinomonadaceae bacterium]